MSHWFFHHFFVIDFSKHLKDFFHFYILYLLLMVPYSFYTLNNKYWIRIQYINSSYLSYIGWGGNVGERELEKQVVPKFAQFIFREKTGSGKSGKFLLFRVWFGDMAYCWILFTIYTNFDIFDIKISNFTVYIQFFLKNWVLRCIHILSK